MLEPLIFFKPDPLFGTWLRVITQLQQKMFDKCHSGKIHLIMEDNILKFANSICNNNIYS